MSWGRENASRSRDPFEERWPDLSRGLHQALRARYIPASRREDIVQETGLRLFMRWADLDPERPVWPFALTIAINLLKDEQRMEARRSASPPPRVAAGIGRGVEEEALARLELTRVQEALKKLTPAQRSVLLADLGELPYDDRGPAALKMLRMRARRTLRSVIDRASALIPAAWTQARRASNAVGVNLQRHAGAEQAPLVVLSTFGIAGAATIVATALGLGPPVGPAQGGLASETMQVATSSGSPHARELVPVAYRDRSAPAGAGTRGPRGLTPAFDHHGHRVESAGPRTTVAAGGTGIDEEPSLGSDRWRVGVAATATVAGREASLEYEVEQSNPDCGSPVGTSGSSRTCLRPEAPRARGQATVQESPRDARR